MAATAPPDSSASAPEPPTNEKRPEPPRFASSALVGDYRHSPFPPLALMQGRGRSVSAALSASLEPKADKGKGKDEDGVDWAKGRKGLTPGTAAKKLFPKPSPNKRLYRRFFIKRDLVEGREWTPTELEEAAQRGNFPQRPSDLFLKTTLWKMYADVLTCLARDPLAGNVSPALIGSQGTIPLSIVSTIPDIIKHYYDTAPTRPSNSVNTIASALRELNTRVEKRKGEKIVVKIMWDRGAIQQLWSNHVDVESSTWIPLGLPAPDDLPQLSLQVVNFHRPLVGTFHQKAMVVDRKIALLNSNNIQDRPNLEARCLTARSRSAAEADAARIAQMMVHLEGPIVDSIYDNILISWHNALSPSLPCLAVPSPYSPLAPLPFAYTFSDSNRYLAQIDVAKAAKAARILLSRQDEKAKKGEQMESLSPPEWWRRDSTPAPPGAHPHHRGWSLNLGGGGSGGAAAGGGGGEDGEHGGKFANLVMQLVEKAREEKARVALGMTGMSVRSGLNLGTRENTETAGASDGPGPSPLGASEPMQAASYEGEGRTSMADSGVEMGSKRSEKAHLLEKAFQEEPAEIPSKGTASSARLAALSKALNAGALAKIEAAIDDETLIHDFKPHMLHKGHEPFPIALVNRRPHGSPGHRDIRCPQDAAWLAALRYAEKNVFIQTPTLNARPIVRGIVEACSRGGKDGKGIQITLFLDLGFNDQGESIPFQGGTNEQVVFRLYRQLTKLGKEKNLHVYWYTGKDQIKPMRALHKSRNCHIKFLAVDGQCAIVGNGNLDSQSFWHSQEANILIDSPQIVSDWMAQLRTNQSTHKYGRVDTDGIWRDPVTGEELEEGKTVNCFTALRAVI
ncbi:SPOSA6832_01187, partial [Sporobolomyces salmonicolor]